MKVFERSVNAHKKKYNLGKPYFTIMNEVERVTHVVEETYRKKIYIPVEFYADVNNDKYYLVDGITKTIVFCGNLDSSPAETINKDLNEFSLYYNVMIAFVLNDTWALNEMFSDKVTVELLKKEFCSVGWVYHIGPCSTRIKKCNYTV